jgi:Zn-dependent peptidase ImmA (M78 family)/transcriptional regulator with XRE-family HTH domain
MNGERIKLARKRLGLSLRDLADEMNGLVSAQAIGKYERGEMLPSSEVLIALSRALKVSRSYLLAAHAVELGAVEFRTKANTSAKDRARVETEVFEWVERYLQIEEILHLDSSAWSVPKDLSRQIRTPNDAEKLADDLRVKWKLGIDPILNVTELLEEKGFKVLLADLPERVSGLTCLVKRPSRGSEIPVIVVNRNHTLERRRLTLAHELAHRVIFAPRIDEAQLEKLCNRFAGAFLVPAQHLKNEIGVNRSTFGYQEIIDLKRLYRVSGGAFLMRLEQIGAISQGAKEYAFRTFASGWRSAEPMPLEDPEEAEKLEEPKRFKRLVYRAAAEDMISLSKAVELLRLPLDDIEKALNGPTDSYADRR